MKMNIRVITLILMFAVFNFGQVSEEVTLITKTGNIFGTLLTPEKEDGVPVAIIIAGSGPTDRDGNNPQMKNNSLKMLAESLAQKNIATLRYDKRGIAASKLAGINESDLRFDIYIEDVNKWIEYLKSKNKFSEIIIIGHSEGALIGMVAARNSSVKKYVSIAGAGLSADKVILEQLKSQPSVVMEKSKPIIAKLKNGKTVDNVPQMLFSLFRPSVQPYMISWFKYDPQEEIKKLAIPVLIIQGTTDIQISKEDADKLASVYPKAKLKFIEGMNHILKKADADRVKNISTYNQPELPIVEELINEINKFVLN